MSEVEVGEADATATENAETPAAGRGRPRPDGTIERDKRVLAYLTENGAKTRKEIVEGTELPGNEVYLSLYRLSRQDPPAVKRTGGSWSVEGAVEAPPTE